MDGFLSTFKGKRICSSLSMGWHSYVKKCLNQLKWYNFFSVTTHLSRWVSLSSVTNWPVKVGESFTQVVSEKQKLGFLRFLFAFFRWQRRIELVQQDLWANDGSKKKSFWISVLKCSLLLSLFVSICISPNFCAGFLFICFFWFHFLRLFFFFVISSVCLFPIHLSLSPCRFRGHVSQN